MHLFFEIDCVHRVFFIDFVNRVVFVLLFGKQVLWNHGKREHGWVRFDSSCAPRRKEHCFELSIKTKQAKEYYEFNIERYDIFHSWGNLFLEQ